ncbi:MAG: helix-turn-helix domain-containing protein [Blastochloris sp.]|nr:helix-turn-helix domain-containing protein [Blastochloris sp.]
MAQLYTVRDAAEYLKVSEQTVLKYIKQNELKATKLGKRAYRIREEDLDAFVRAQTERTSPNE